MLLLTECQDLLGPVSSEATSPNIFCPITESFHRSACGLFHILVWVNSFNVQTKIALNN